MTDSQVDVGDDQPDPEWIDALVAHVADAANETEEETVD